MENPLQADFVGMLRAAAWCAALSVVATGATTTSSNAAEDESGRGTWGAGIEEFRLGVLAHNKGPIASHREHGVQLNVEFLFDSPSFLKYILSPRPHIGGSVNTTGQTSFVYTGLTWTWDIYQGLFLDFSLGGAVHDGWLESSDPAPNRRLLGSRVLFRESIELGYRFFDHHSLSIMLDHVSNAGLLSDRNQGNDDIGIRYGWHY